jgi:hypothetical protein
MAIASNGDAVDGAAASPAEIAEKERLQKRYPAMHAAERDHVNRPAGETPEQERLRRRYPAMHAAEGGADGGPPPSPAPAAAASAAGTQSNAAAAPAAALPASGASVPEPVVVEGLRFPAGSTVDSNLVRQFNELAPGLDQDSRQEVVDFYAGLQKQDAERWRDEVAGWQRDVEKEFSASDMDSARDVISEFGDAALIEELKWSGFDRNPALVRLVVKVARKLGAGAGR